MSRTHKDKSWKLRHPEERFDFGRIAHEYDAKSRVFDEASGEWVLSETEVVRRTWIAEQRGCKTKKRKQVDTCWHWLTTPSWWIRLMMTRPQRRASRVWERKALLADLDSLDTPSCSKKPHIYFW